MTSSILLDKYEGLIKKAANSFYNVDKEDLIQAGKLALVKAYQNYIDDGTCKFSTYAYKYIYGEMYNLVVNNNTIKLNKYLLKVKKLAEKTRYNLAQSMGRIPTNHEVAQYLEMDEGLIDQVSNYQINSLDMKTEDNYSLYEIIPQKENISVDQRIDIHNSLNKLDEKERQIIESRYYNDMTQSEVARKLKMTQVMVSRYEKKGIEKMRQYMI